MRPEHTRACHPHEAGGVVGNSNPGEPDDVPLPHVESFHNRMRDELLEDNSIENLDHARLLVDQWSQRYNNFHPHSSLGYLSPRQYAEQWKQENTVNA